jgi:hypothetical protein
MAGVIFLLAIRLIRGTTTKTERIQTTDKDQGGHLPHRSLAIIALQIYTRLRHRTYIPLRLHEDLLHVVRVRRARMSPMTHVMATFQSRSMQMCTFPLIHEGMQSFLEIETHTRLRQQLKPDEILRAENRLALRGRRLETSVNFVLRLHTICLYDFRTIFVSGRLLLTNLGRDILLCFFEKISTPLPLRSTKVNVHRVIPPDDQRLSEALVLYQIHLLLFPSQTHQLDSEMLLIWPSEENLPKKH